MWFKWIPFLLASLLAAENTSSGFQSSNVTEESASPDLHVCRTNWSCIQYCSSRNFGAGAPCSYTATYKVAGDEGVHYHIAAARANFVAIAFTDDVKKRHSEVIACDGSLGKVQLKLYYLEDFSFHRLTEVSFIESNMKLMGFTINDGISCEVWRSLSRWSRQTKDLRDDFYQIYIWGHATNDGKLDESTIKWEMSLLRLDLMKTTTIKTTILDHNKYLNSTMQNCIGSSNCACISVTKRQSVCTFDKCSYVASFQPVIPPAHKWSVILSVAKGEFVGLERMWNLTQKGEAEVMGCLKSNTSAVVPFHYWSGKRTMNLFPKELGTLKLLAAASSNDGLWCHLARLIERKENPLDFSLPTHFAFLWGTLDQRNEPILRSPPSYRIVSKIVVDLTAPETVLECVAEHAHGIKHTCSSGLFYVLVTVAILLYKIGK